MTKLLLAVLNMSLTGSLVILAVLALRLLLRRAPKGVTCLLWAVVFFRLLCPFSLESTLSLLPTAQVLVPAETAAEPPRVNTGVAAINQAVNPYLEEHWSSPAAGPLQTVPADPFPAQGTPSGSATGRWTGRGGAELLEMAAWVWLMGFLYLCTWSAGSWLCLRQQLAGAKEREAGVYMSPGIETPFLLGILRPRIYVPEGMEGEQLEDVLAHERAHLRRGDSLWKLLAWLAAALHWFNPLVWLSFHLLSRDMEHACDERATRGMDLARRKAYSMTLLQLAAPRSFSAGCPVAFGEVSTRERVRRVLNCHRPAFWLAVTAVAAVILTAVCFGSNPSREDNATYQSFISRVEGAKELALVPSLISSTLYPRLEDAGLIEQMRQVLLEGTDPEEAPPPEDIILNGERVLVDGENYILRKSGDGWALCGPWTGKEPVPVAAVYQADVLERLRDIVQQQRDRNRAESGSEIPLPPGQPSTAYSVTLEQLDAARPAEAFPWIDEDPAGVLLLGELPTLEMKLYGYYAGDGKGSAEAVLVRTGDRIEVYEDLYWTGSFYREGRVGLYAGDYDGDSQQEAVLVLLNGWGTGCYVQGLYLFDVQPDGSHTLRALDGETLTALVMEGISCTWNPAGGLWRLYDGGGPTWSSSLLWEETLDFWDMKENGPEERVYVENLEAAGGELVSFQIEGDSIILSAGLGYIGQGPIPNYPSENFTAPVRWDGERFVRGSFAAEDRENYRLIGHMDPTWTYGYDYDITLERDSQSAQEHACRSVTIRTQSKLGNGPEQTLTYRYDDMAGWGCGDHFIGAVLLADVDFDGMDDLLLDLGRFGNRGVVHMACFRWRGPEEGYVLDPAFENLDNPVVDWRAGVIRTSGSDVTGSSYSIWQYVDGELTRTARLQEDWSGGDHSQAVWTEEKYDAAAGRWTVTRESTQSRGKPLPDWVEDEWKVYNSIWLA